LKCFDSSWQLGSPSRGGWSRWFDLKQQAIICIADNPIYSDDVTGPVAQLDNDFGFIRARKAVASKKVLSESVLRSFRAETVSGPAPVMDFL
jgi:hypothetical protein